ncbi:MAG: DUF362 domain-containing protein [Candidatus Electryonea clarkiae]|nr:DUF362 domain-containing protein [Candidatus Electryonea clarkiae]MDP8286301.1 DUF362 domain-containing protein [Candidatus Electryonea clarkiae]
MRRRKFIKVSGAAAGGFVLGFPLLKTYAQTGQSDLVLIRNGSPAQMIRKSIELLGGMSRFVNSGQTVVLKPNMSWDYGPEYATNTNPEAAAEVVKLCLEAGAKKVLSFDNSCQEARRCYISSGLEKAMSDAGASVRFIRDKLFEEVEIPGASKLKKWEFYVEALEADVLISMPVLKHHSLSKVSLGLKNMMGLIGGKRGMLHFSFGQKIADINRVLKPQLTIIDAVRILKRNGPSGGNLNDVEQKNTIIAGIDPVLVDAWGVKLFGLEPDKLGWLTHADRAGIGTMNTAENIPLEYSYI